MDNKNSKTIFKTAADDCLAKLHQVDSDFALAQALQEQERAMLSFAPSESSESESEEGSEEGDEILSDDETEVVNFHDSFESQTEADLEFLGTYEDSFDQEMEEDDIDPDELSYEELVDVGEIVGEEGKGMKLEEISSCLRLFACPHAVELNMCVICQVDYKQGEMLVALPCHHPYHLDCITKWLQIKKICPICSSDVSAHKIARTV